MNEFTRIDFANLDFTMVPKTPTSGTMHIEWIGNDTYEIYFWDYEGQYYRSEIPKQLSLAIKSMAENLNNRILGED